MLTGGAFLSFALFLSLHIPVAVVITYLFLTIMRNVRDNFRAWGYLGSISVMLKKEIAGLQLT